MRGKIVFGAALAVAVWAGSPRSARACGAGRGGGGTSGLEALVVAALVAGSSNDEYVTPERARFFAGKWGARYADMGPRGHLNSASKLGPWLEGQALLEELLRGRSW